MAQRTTDDLQMELMTRADLQGFLQDNQAELVEPNMAMVGAICLTSVENEREQQPVGRRHEEHAVPPQVKAADGQDVRADCPGNSKKIKHIVQLVR